MNLGVDQVMEQTIQIYEVKHNEQYNIQLHHHELTQLLYVIDGSGSIMIDGTLQEISANTAALIVPYSQHAVSSTSRLTLLVLTFDDTSVHEPMRLEWQEHYYKHSDVFQLNSIMSNELRLLLRKLLFEGHRVDRFSKWAIRIHLHEIILLLARAKNAAHITDTISLRAERIRSFIDNHYFEAISSVELAAKMKMSIRHLNATFKEQYSITPMQYLTKVRIGVAQKLLAETNKDIISICFEIGYESLPTFYRTFKNAAHQSPKQYRSQYQEKIK
jgi:AraC-like DNA-binding protein/mannose-6-phosphate isomerase-like protein (cupin superfamily)